MLAATVAAADGPSPSATGFNAVDGDPRELMIAVGDHGAIVHITGGSRSYRVDSPTEADLVDVDVGSNDFAVSIGQGVVLLWDGIRWRHLTEQAGNVANAHAWASPDELLVLYTSGTDGNRVCPWIPDAYRQPFCRQFNAPMRGACGNHETIHLVLANGEIHRVNDALLGKDGQFGPIYQPDEPLELKFAWVPEKTCAPDRIPEVYAVDVSSGLVHFNGRSWQAMDPASSHVAGLQAGLFGVLTDLDSVGLE